MKKGSHLSAANKLLARAQSLRPGEVLIYHIGFLAKDRRGNPALDLVARGMLDLAQLRRGRLVQRRRDLDRYDYLFQCSEANGDA